METIVYYVVWIAGAVALTKCVFKLVDWIEGK